MPKTAGFAGSVLALILNATAIANMADNAASSPLTSLYLSLHTANPIAGDQTTSEATYTNYVRLAVARTSGGFTVNTSAGTATNAATISFAQSGGTQNVITHVGIGSASSGSGVLYFAQALAASRTIDSGDTPEFDAGDLDFTET